MILIELPKALFMLGGSILVATIGLLVVELINLINGRKKK